jgi:membrane-bound serine protease (ClpP class)
MDPLFWACILIALGFCVVVLELFLPSAGMLGVLAAALIIAGIVLAFMSNFRTGGIVLLVTVLALPIVLIAMLKVWPHTPIGRRILLDERKPEQLLPASLYSSELIGQLGIAKTKMLPSGIVLVNHQKLDAVSHGFAIEPGQPIKIINVSGNHIYVEPYEEDLEDAEDLPVRDRDMLAQPFEEFGLDSLDEPCEGS